MSTNLTLPAIACWQGEQETFELKCGTDDAEKEKKEQQEKEVYWRKHGLCAEHTALNANQYLPNFPDLVLFKTQTYASLPEIPPDVS